MKEYAVYICKGRGKNYRESGEYTAFGTSYLDTIRKYTQATNKVNPFYRYGANWRKVGRRKGMPKEHCYVMDEVGNKFLLIPRNWAHRR